MKRALKILGIVIAAGVGIVAIAALAFYLMVKPGPGPELERCLPADLDWAARLEDSAGAVDVLAGWGPLKRLEGKRAAGALGLELPADGDARSDLLDYCRLAGGSECAVAMKLVNGEPPHALYLARIGFGVAAREWALRHFAPDGMVATEQVENITVTRVETGDPVGTVHYCLVGDVLMVSDSAGLMASAIAAATGGDGIPRFRLPGGDARTKAAAASLRRAVEGLSGIPTRALQGGFGFAGLPWPAGAATLTVEADETGRLSLEGAVGFDPALLPPRLLRTAQLGPSDWTPLELVPSEAYFLWVWRGADWWHLAQLFALIAVERKESLRDEAVLLEIERIVYDRVGRHFTGDFAAFCTPRKTRHSGGGYPAVTWVFGVDDIEAVRRAMLGSAARWTTGIKSAGTGADLEYPYIEEASHHMTRTYLVRGGFMRVSHGYEPCFSFLPRKGGGKIGEGEAPGGYLIASSSPAGLHMALDASAGRSLRLKTGPLPGPAEGGRSFLLYAVRPPTMVQLSNLYDYQIELYRKHRLSPAQALTDTTDYRLYYDVFEEAAGLFDRVALVGRYEGEIGLRLWGEVDPAP